METTSRIALKVFCIFAEGRGAKTHSAVLLGQATVLAAINSQAKVLSKVKIVIGEIPAPLPPSNAVYFDRVRDSDSLSLTAGALGAGTKQYTLGGRTP